eukprot:gene12947-14279_t
MKDVKEFLTLKQSENQFSDRWASLQHLYEKRLWHELTVDLMKFLKEDHFKKNGGLQEIYEHFLSDFEHRINPLSLTEMILIIGKEIKGSEKLAFYEKTRERVKNNTEATVLLLTAMGNVRLEDNKLEEAKQLIREAQALLDTMDGVSTVHGRFYDLSSNYCKVIGSFSRYYRHALRYLGCMNLSELPADELKQRAFNLSLAALLGDEVYNFGELLAHEVLQYLKDTDNAWLVDMLYAFNSGDIKKFKGLEKHWKSQADLATNERGLMQKITLLSLMELTFRRPSNERTTPFSVIAQETNMPLKEVEMLVMKALSLGLIKGYIDEVDKVVHVTWVQPRVLDLNQINTIKDSLGSWCEKVKESARMVEDQVPELLVTS